MAGGLELFEPTLWRVSAFGEDERHPRGRRYWWDNAGRRVGGGCVQATLEGSIGFEHAGAAHEVGPGTLLIFLYGEDSRYGRREPLARGYRCAWLGLEGAGVVEHLRAIRSLVGPVVPDESGRPLTAELHAVQALVRERGGASPMAVAAAVHRFVLGVYESAVAERRRELTPVERAVERLISQPFTGDTTQDLADRFGVSREHLTRVFTQQHGHPPAAWLTRRRLDRAIRLLQNTGLTVNDIARQVGLPDGHALARQLRRHTGKPPRQWRER